MDKIFSKYLNREWRFCQQRFPDKQFAFEIFLKWKEQIFANRDKVVSSLKKKYGDRNDDVDRQI